MLFVDTAFVVCSTLRAEYGIVAHRDSKPPSLLFTMTTAAPEVEGQMSPQAVEGIAGEHNSALMTLDEPVSATIVSCGI